MANHRMAGIKHRLFSNMKPDKPERNVELDIIKSGLVLIMLFYSCASVSLVLVGMATYLMTVAIDRMKKSLPLSNKAYRVVFQ